ncbi:MAG: TIGR00266 family protein [Halanaerobiales bacterium]|nr:TIGR00266 family protein [Halanaerobiales bacterium]
MKYRIEGDNLPVVICELEPGEILFTESGGMSWMTKNIQMETNMEGGLLGGLMRTFSGESLFMVTYTCKREKGEIAFASSMPGHIIDLELASGESIICQKSAFLCAERSVKLESYFKKRLGAGLFGGEGFILQKLTGPGKVFLEMDGSIVKRELARGEILKVDTGHVGAFSPNVRFDISTVKGFKNIFFGGEGLFLTELEGPGVVWLQTMPIENVARRLIPLLPKSKD